MNGTQRKVLLVTAIVIALMVLFPPYEVKNYRQVTIMSGYGFLFALPEYQSLTASIPAYVNVQTLIVQILGAIVVGGLVYFACGKKT